MSQRRGFMGGLNRDWNRFLGHTRGKCRYGPNHESCTRVGDFWRGESTNDFACDMAPSQICPKCEGAREIELAPDEAIVRQYDGPVQVWGDGVRRRDALDGTQNAWGDGKRWVPCLVCEGQGTVPGPHWPWRHDHPGSLPLELLS